MLPPSDLARIRDRFAVYDHEWRAYAPVLGEPHLVEDCLVYFDGTLASVCAYRLGDPSFELDQPALASLLEGLPVLDRVRAVGIWGRFSCPTTLRLPCGAGSVRSLVRVRFEDYAPEKVES